MIHQSKSQDFINRVTCNCPSGGRQRGRREENENEGVHVKMTCFPDQIQSTTVDHVLVCGMSIREVYLHAHLQGVQQCNESECFSKLIVEFLCNCIPLFMLL